MKIYRTVPTGDELIFALYFSAVIEDNPDDPAVPFQMLMTEEENAVFKDSVRAVVNYTVSVTSLVKDVTGKDLASERSSMLFRIGMHYFRYIVTLSKTYVW